MKEITAIVMVPHRVKFQTDIEDVNHAARRAAAAIKTSHTVLPVLHSVTNVDDLGNVKNIRPMEVPVDPGPDEPTPPEAA